jgi:hypothetical protein
MKDIMKIFSLNINYIVKKERSSVDDEYPFFSKQKYRSSDKYFED